MHNEMTPTVSEAFPNWYRASRTPTDATWAAEADLTNPEVVRDIGCMVRGDLGSPERIARDVALHEVLSLGTTICADIARFTRPWSTDPDVGRQLIGALLIAATSACVGFRAMHEGDIRTARDWVVRPIVRPEVDGWHEYMAPSRGSVFFQPEAALPDGLVVPFATEWAELLFVYERFHGPVGNAGTVVFEALEPWLVERLFAYPDLGHLALAAAEWSCRREIEDDRLQDAIHEFNRRGIDVPEVEVAAAVHLAEVARRRGSDPAAEGQGALETFRGRLNGTQVLRLTGLVAGGDPEATVRSIGAVCSTIESVMRDWRSTTSSLQTMGDRRGAHFKLVGNLLEALLQAGRPDMIGDLLGAWLEVGPAARRRDLLFCFSTETPGVGWAGRQEIHLRADLPAVCRYLQAFGQFTGMALHVADSDEIEFAAPTGRPGIPNSDWGGELERAALEVLSVGELQKVERDAALPPRALVVIPYAGCPVQAMLIKHHGFAWPWSVSLASPLPDRPVDHVRVVVTGTEMGHLEASGLRMLFDQSAISIELIDDPGLDRSDFLDLYHDTDSDVLWVIGHGEFDSHDPQSSCLLMPNGSSVEATALTAPNGAGRRRLLVLNVCDAAVAAVTGGLPEIGIGPAAAGPMQAVIGHLWPVLGWPDGALFGRLLADGLTAGNSFFGAYENAIRILVAGPSVVTSVLDGGAGDLDAELRSAVSARHGERMSELAFWSSAAFLE